MIKEVSLCAAEGEVVCMLGANGAGKSLLLRTVAGMVNPISGVISFDGIDIGQLPPNERVRLGITLVPEGRRMFPRMTVLENLLVGSSNAVARKQRKDSFELVFSLFPRLKERGKQLAGTLSGGEQQMLALARGLVSCPKLLLCDELSLGLAPFLITECYEKLMAISRLGVTILLTEQNVRQALKVSARAYILANGMVTFAGDAKSLEEDPRLWQAYLGIKSKD